MQFAAEIFKNLVYFLYSYKQSFCMQTIILRANNHFACKCRLVSFHYWKTFYYYCIIHLIFQIRSTCAPWGKNKCQGIGRALTECLMFSRLVYHTSTAMMMMAAFFLIVELLGRLTSEWTPMPRLAIGGRSSQSGSRIPPIQSLAMG